MERPIPSETKENVKKSNGSSIYSIIKAKP